MADDSHNINRPVEPVGTGKYLTIRALQALARLLVVLHLLGASLAFAGSIVLHFLGELGLLSSPADRIQITVSLLILTVVLLYTAMPWVIVVVFGNMANEIRQLQRHVTYLSVGQDGICNRLEALINAER